jgi:hypothetical protein
MQHFYDGQIRRYITQTIRVFSNFVVKYGDGTLHRVPVMYGDADRQVASILRQNSENAVNSVPRISVYVSSLALDRERTSDATFVSKMHFRERDVQTDPATGHTTYKQTQGRNYTVERLMPTPFKLTMKVDIWSANTDQRLQILEQILVLFNPSLELQTTDNYIDWTSLTVLNLNDIAWDSRTVPSGTDTAIDISTLTVDTPIWISPPVKVKHLGVITKIVTSLFGAIDSGGGGYIDGLGEDLAYPYSQNYSDLLATEITTITDYILQVYNSQAILLSPNEGYTPREPTLDIPVRSGVPISWDSALSHYPGKFHAGSSRLYLTQPNGSQIVGTVALPIDASGDIADSSTMLVQWDTDTLTTNTGIDSQGRFDFEQDYAPPGYRNGTPGSKGSPGTFDAIINPLTYNPGTPDLGARYLIVEDIGNIDNAVPAAAWGNLVALANDIIEWNGTEWHVIFAANQDRDTMIWQTNIYTGVQYTWDGMSWSKSFEGEYQPGSWRLEL